ncbi:MAG: hypothetical protein PUA85_04245 [Oscillospiraceae bacterium]|nr:hypothetical protein [Oscillospiraceae bacterium]
MQINSAYIDASSINMIIAAVASVVVTVGAVVVVYVRRMKNKVKDKLGIKGKDKVTETKEIEGSFDD